MTNSDQEFYRQLLTRAEQEQGRKNNFNLKDIYISKEALEMVRSWRNMGYCEDCQSEYHGSHTKIECNNNRSGFYRERWGKPDEPKEKIRGYRSNCIIADEFDAENFNNTHITDENGSKIPVPKGFNYSPYFQQDKDPKNLAQKLLVFMHEIIKLTEQERLVRGKDLVFKKLFEEIGEYAVASLGDKEVTESPRQELIDCFIMILSLYTLEGGTLELLTDYGAVKLEKWRKKMEA